MTRLLSGAGIVSCELITERGPTVGITALQIFVGAFRSTEQPAEMKGRREKKREGRGREYHQTGAKLADHKLDLCVYYAAFLCEVKEAWKATDKIKVFLADSKKNP